MSEEKDEKKPTKCNVTDCVNYNEEMENNCQALEDVDFGEKSCSFFKKKVSYQTMPPLTEEEYKDLRNDIMDRGVMVPVELDENGVILDGHHRVMICKELGITDYPTVIRTGLTEEEKILHSKKLNIARRHLTQEQKREVVMGQLKLTPEMSDRRIAESLGISHNTVRTVREKGERRGQIDHVGTVIDKLGRKQPRTKVPALTPQRPTATTELGPEDMWVDVEAPPMPKKERKKKEYILIPPDPAEIKEKYDVVVVDPPWPARMSSDEVEETKLPPDYEMMSIDEIKEFPLPAAQDCHVFLWANDWFLKTAFEVFEAWDVEFMYLFVWHKDRGYRSAGSPIVNGEYCLCGRIGAARFISGDAFLTVFDAPAAPFGKPAIRPAEFYDMIKNATQGKRIDMFSHKKYDGFTPWGRS